MIFGRWYIQLARVWHMALLFTIVHLSDFFNLNYCFVFVHSFYIFFFNLLSIN